MLFSTKVRNSFKLLLTYILIILNYFIVVSKTFHYSGYTTDYFDTTKLLISIIMFFIVLLIYLLINNDFYRLVYSCYLVLVYIGQSVSYIYRDTYFVLLIYVSIPLILLYIVDRFDKSMTFKTIKLNLNDRFTFIMFYLILILCILPFLKYYNTINLRNLLLQDIYDTRRLIKEYDRDLLGYLVYPITRVILPFLIVYSLKLKKKLIFCSSVFFLVLMFLLNGAVKSIFFGLFVSLFFYRGDLKTKETFFVNTFNFITFSSILEYIIFSSFKIADYIRRLIFTPPNLFNVYYDYFNNNHTHFLHSRISKILKINTYSGSLSAFIGTEVMGIEGLNANVGIFAEGYLSFGSLGVIIASLFFILIVVYIRRLDLEPSYFGIFFIFIYVVNTSFIEPLLLTHGLFAYLFFATFFIPTSQLEYKEKLRCH